MPRAGMIRAVGVRVAICDHGVGGPFDDVVQDAIPPRRRRRQTWTKNGYGDCPYGMTALTVRIDR